MYFCRLPITAVRLGKGSQCSQRQYHGVQTLGEDRQGCDSEDASIFASEYRATTFEWLCTRTYLAQNRLYLTASSRGPSVVWYLARRLLPH